MTAAVSTDRDPNVLAAELSSALLARGWKVTEAESPGGIEATSRIKREIPSAGIVILAVDEDEEALFDAIKAGADYVIVGRAIYEAPGPGKAARDLAEEIEGVL